MKDKNGYDLAIGDLVECRVWTDGGAALTIGSIIGFRDSEHIHVRLRKARYRNTGLLCYLGIVVQKIPEEKAFLYLLEE